MGDMNGIGPEIALKTAIHRSVQALCKPMLVGPLNVFEHVRSELRLKVQLQKAAALLPKGPAVSVQDVGDGIWADVEYGKPTKVSGKTAGTAIEAAVNLCLTGKAQAMVTAPASKEALHLAGYNFPGQTEMITLLSRSSRVAMMLVSDKMRVGLVTIHIPVRDISDRVTTDKILEKLEILDGSLRLDFLIRKPRIAVLGLNPHAGENGIIGGEERDAILPAIERGQKSGIRAEGPFPADGFFGDKRHRDYDAVLAMYHDQGLVPLKLSSFGKAVNFSAGLAIIRTSPDHGTAYDIAGKGKARIESMLEAVKLAVAISRNRHD
ncbi:MAG: 4-hydroxythreonine-4-phosphate dehydrogenase PdxA [Ignavibacteriales bacterium]|nr:4-hydroxythreonine-4-phosphate dehydrogenase PdxA [Ignavibacteriales bacterium]